MVSSEVLLLALLLTPALCALFAAFVVPTATAALRWIGSLGTGLTFALSCLVTLVYLSETPDPAHGMRMFFTTPWIPGWNVNFSIGLDGISLPLLVLTALICWLAMLASWSITSHVKGYVILFLLLETGLLGVFLALDIFLFYVFWEVMLLPMYFLIGLWGGPRREYAAIKFFLYTLFGGVLMLIAMLMLYFAGQHSFDLLRLADIGQGLDPDLQFSSTFQLTVFLLLLVGFLIKLPAVPFHTWLPDAHVEAPTPVSMILAGVLLKMGGYGLLRVAFPICPVAVHTCAYGIVLLGVVGILYGALAALAQTDFKRLVAYSSVSHMGYVLVGLGVWKLSTGDDRSLDSWQMGLNAALFQMVAHGISSAGMFFLVGMLYDRVHHRDLNQFGGIAQRMPHSIGIAGGLFFASLGLPGLCGFIGEVFAVISAWPFDQRLAILSALGTILTAAYILWTFQRVYLGPRYTGPHDDGLVAEQPRELFIGYTLLVVAIVLGILPNLVFTVSGPTLQRLAKNMNVAVNENRVPAVSFQNGAMPSSSPAQNDNKAAEPATVGLR